MGCCGSTSDPQDREVQKELNISRKEDEDEFKLLLLGAGGSGKSTLFKQLEYIHGDGFPKSRRMLFRKQIHEQLLDAMKTMVVSCREYVENDPEQNAQYKLYDYDLDTKTDDTDDAGAGSTENAEGIRAAALGIKAVRNNSKFTPQVVEYLKELWANDVIQKMYELRNEICVPDSTKYFLDDLDRITDPDYVPEDKDLILVRYRTTGMLEKNFVIKDHKFKICDVGGQRSERRKWMNFFSNVTSVIFVVSLSCYDELTFEEETNAMTTSIEVFDEQVNGEWFKDTPFILFLNKSDLFFEKIKTVPIKECAEFAEYGGADDDERQSLDYIKEVLCATNQNPNRSLFTHVTNATNKDQIEKVFNDVQTMIINWALERAGLT